MRWVKPKSRRKELEAPEWLRKEWQNGNKKVMADLLSHLNFEREAFLNKMLICIRKKQTVIPSFSCFGKTQAMQLRMQIMRAKIDGAKARCTSLGASHHRNNQYDGEPEFWVIVKESGARKEESSYEEMHQKQQQAKEDPSFNLGGDKFKGLEQHSNRLADVAKTGETQTPVDNKYAQ
ncbi:unnamed protein product, partial [Effrenium voratum]